LAASALISLGFTVIDLSGYQALPARVVNPFSPVSFSKCAWDIPQAGDNFTMFKIRSSKQVCYYIGFLIFMILSSNHTKKNWCPIPSSIIFGSNHHVDPLFRQANPKGHRQS
jgi:hypothetical protein